MSEIVGYVAAFPNGQHVLVQQHISDDGNSFMTVALRGERVNSWGPPQLLELAPSSRDPLIPVPEVVCPGCGAVAMRRGEQGGLETAHEAECTWLNDPNAEPYG